MDNQYYHGVWAIAMIAASFVEIKAHLISKISSNS
jgi:hypothetical protein